MNATTLDDLRPRAPGGLSRAALLALVAHGLLLLALSLGVSWRTSEPAGVEAELWSAVPQVAAPRAVAPPPPTPAPPAPTPKPVVEPKPAPPPPDRDADIAREKREQKERLEKQRLEDERKEEARKQKERKQQERAEAEKREAEQERREAEKREADKRKAAEATKLAAKAREEQMQRMNAQLGATGAPDSTGTAAQSSGPSASYAGRIKARIKPNVVFAEDIAGNPMAAVEVKVAPDGTIVGRRLVKSSGVPSWDEAVLRAIDKTEVLPRDTDGRVPPALLLEFRPRDF